MDNTSNSYVLYCLYINIMTHMEDSNVPSPEVLPTFSSRRIRMNMKDYDAVRIKLIQQGKGSFTEFVNAKMAEYLAE